jgi:glucose-1-phosphate thymidylyltransferase
VHYLKQGTLTVNLMGRGYAWLDTGTYEDLIKASTFVEVVESRQGIKIACLEEISFSNGWIDAERLISEAEKMKNSDYGRYLLNIIKEIKSGLF